MLALPDAQDTARLQRLKFLLKRGEVARYWEVECLGCSRCFRKLGEKRYRRKKICSWFPQLCFIDQMNAQRKIAFDTSRIKREVRE
jgi:hypothetical protein